MKYFPIPADANYSYEQSYTLLHGGVDIFAPLNTPLVAVDDGVAWRDTEPKGGNVVYLQSIAVGRRYFYGHLNGWAPQVYAATKLNPVRVRAGDVIGFVGSTGNAEGRPTHVHFLMRVQQLFGKSEVVDPFHELMAADPKKAGRPLAMGSGGEGGGWWEDLWGAREGLRKVATVGLVLWLASKVMDRK